MTIGVLWEFGEFAADRYFRLDMQKDRVVQKISSVKILNLPPMKIQNVQMRLKL